MTHHVSALLPGDGDRVPERRFYTPLDLEHYDELRKIHEILGDWLAGNRLLTPGKTYDHDPRPDDRESGAPDRCKDCGEDVTWIGPTLRDWLHVDDKENR